MNWGYVILPIVASIVLCDIETVRNVGSASGEWTRYIMTTYKPFEKITTFINAFRDKL